MHSLTGKSKGSPGRWQRKGLETRERRPDGFLMCQHLQVSAEGGGGPPLPHAQVLQVFGTIYPFLFTQSSWQNFTILT